MIEIPKVFQTKSKWYFTLEERLFGPYSTKKIAEAQALFWHRELIVHGSVKNDG